MQKKNEGEILGKIKGKWKLSELPNLFPSFPREGWTYHSQWNIRKSKNEWVNIRAPDYPFDK